MARRDDEGAGGPAKSFLEHLEDLRRVLLGVLLLVMVGMAVSSQFAPRILQVLKAPLRAAGRDPDTFLRSFSVTGAMNVALQTMFWGGLLLSLPFAVLLIAAYVAPALRTRERRVVATWAWAAVLMFAVGVACAYRMLPAALRVMLWFNEWMGIPIDFVLVTDYIRFVLLLLASFGILFEIPMVILLLGRLGVITSRQLREKRRHAIVAVLAAAMIVTPTTDPFTQLVLSVPLIVFFEGCIWVIRFWERRRPPEPAGGEASAPVEAE